MIRPADTRVRFVSRPSRIRLPEPHVVICDRGAPLSLQERFPGALFVTAGERFKTLSSVGKLARDVLRRHADRSITLVAVGGGTVGDAVGFLSGVLWRGVGLVYVPTTLLAMADSAHGGKTAVNLPDAKNQLGVFHPAREVWIVTSLLKALPRELLEEGLAEIVKAALVGDGALARAYFRQGLFGVPLKGALEKAIRVKQRVCARDPFETRGVREVLNFGHTLGHALEHTTPLSHGRAVAWGLCAGALLSERAGFGHVDRVLALLRPLLCAPNRWPQPRVLRRAMALDKKRRDTELRSVVLRDVGRPFVTRALTPEDWIRALGEVRRRVNG